MSPVQRPGDPEGAVHGPGVPEGAVQRPGDPEGAVQGRAGLWWLSSYPKSGNTWMRALLTNYVGDRQTPADINRLDEGHLIASARSVFDDYLGIEASDLTQDEIEGYRPLVYEELARRAARPIYVKVHDAYTLVPGRGPLFPPSASAGVLYLVRNPLDVAVSFAHHSACSVERMVEKMGDPGYAFVSDPRRLHNQLRQRLSTWSGHVEGWLAAEGHRLHVVRYEDLRADTIGVFTGVVRFLGFPDDPERVARAVAFSEFDKLQAQERERGFGEKNPASESFFRKGVVGSWREQLTPALVDRLVADHGPVMARLGYLDGQDRLVY